MSPHAAKAVARLVAVMEQENAALAAMDLRGATGLLAEKTASLAALTENPPGPDQTGPNAASLRHLAQLARENRVLLEHAMEAQKQVIGIVARAAARAVTAPCYGAGPASAAGRAPPIAVSARV